MIRDNRSNALINNDTKEFHAYKMEKNKHKRIENLQKEVSEIRTLINRVITRIEKIENN